MPWITYTAEGDIIINANYYGTKDNKWKEIGLAWVLLIRIVGNESKLALIVWQPHINQIEYS